ncbi:maestro heat-like repeat-containing protein family member 2A isoform X3 [Canis lupus familiaris]|uniref:maestro heat-like repeat-containing protein family member 2A isoform X3 n=2 Tax=Canis lupus familiaris TaxID=9615 RepID=UPI000BAA1F06|nr:maestro heat-like repeat-containing protein family member 2A isoform X3 [Canis lupus familiaris]XP_038291755.1 maestro heat-like repeat-containing protein family member 2A isoform X3 [Canis lupus familiaris]XP_038430176.1 maestro heat-like repeat-containing protein family member 2A isoform X3 [Canis lupus familiaris]|eukprot:XP_022265472.1 maestro heat-like repeat-containing protein family member 2A isoform X3 [Canis lupus familiaris]
MTEAAADSNEDPLEETEDLEPLEPDDGGTFQQVTNLLNIMDSGAAKTDAAGAGPDMRKTLASVIITEKATSEPSVVMNALIRCLQVPKISTQRKVNIYNILQEIIQQEGELEEQGVQRLVAIASKEMRETLEAEGYVKAEVASDTLAALSRNHFSLVMYELQHHLKPLNLTDEFVIITLAKLANGNVFEFMPYMGITLATIFTMLRLANEAKMRQVICSATETFCETVQFYLRHLEDSVYPVMTEDQFAVKLFPLYRYFVTVWLRNQNPEVKLGVIKSLKPMLNLLLPNDDLRDQVYDYIPLLLAEYRGSLEALFITQVLRQILEMSVTTNTPVPEMQLHTIFTELHVQVCAKVPAQQQYSSQNLVEIVQCFIALARSYPKELMKFFFSQIEMSKEAIRVGTLTLIRAVVSADEPRMNIRTISLAIRVVKNTLSDTRFKVRMAILRIIGQLALSGYQDRIKGWGLKYVSVQLTLSTYKLTNHRESFYQRDLEEKMVHKVTMDTVRIITSSVSGMTNEFWVRLLCYIMETDYTEALTPICISLTNLAERQLHTKDAAAGVASKSKHGSVQKSRQPGQRPALIIPEEVLKLCKLPLAGSFLMSPPPAPCPRTPPCGDSAVLQVWLVWVSVSQQVPSVDLPAPQKLLARLLVLMSSPYKGEGRGIAMLNLLRTLSQSIAPSMADMWEVEIPLLVKYLEEHTEFTWNQKTWEDKLIQFLRNSLKKTRGSNWSLRLSKELNNQIESFDSPSLEKGFLYRALGFTLAMGLEADKVEVLLLELLYKTDYSNDFDREGVILCFGLCARGQVKTVLNVLHDFEERIQESEQSWQIGAWRKDHPWRRETVKSALMVIYSCVASYCHPQMLLTHVDNPITAKIIHHYSSSCQDICLKMAFMKSVMQVTKAIKNIKDLEDFQFAQKMTLTGIITATIKEEPTDSLVSPVRTMAMEALSHLSNLKPFYSMEENNELMDISIHSVISLQPPAEDNESIQTLYANAMHALEQLMEGLMQRQLDPKGLQEMVHLLEKWILSEKEGEREKATNLHLHLMQIYVQSIGVCIPLKLGQFGMLVGLMAPCTCDSHRRTRIASMDVLSSLLDLHASQTCSSWGPSKELELAKCKEDLQGPDVEKIFSASSRIAKVACVQFNCDEVVSLIQKLCENIGAMDLQHDKASVTWIGTFLQMRAKELEDKVAEILGAILVHLPVVDHLEVRRCLIEGILLLAHYHQETVLTSLLRQPLPMERHLTEVWLAVAENVPFARTMLHGLMGRLQSRFTPKANATSKADIWRLAAVDPLMTLCTIHLLIQKIDVNDKLLDLFPDLIYTLLLQLSSSQGPEAMSPVLKTWRLVHAGMLPEEINLQRITIQSMQLLFRRLNSEQLVHTLEEQGVWALLQSSSTFLQGVGLLARLCMRSMEGYRQRLSELVLRGMDSDVLSCRISSTAVCVEFMSDPVLYQEKLLKPTVLLLEKGADQEDEALRVLSLRALGNMALGAPKKVRQYRKLLLEKCLDSLRGPVSTSVTSEGMEALAKILAELREGDVGSSFSVLCEQCRAFFDSESELLRLKAFVLFGRLAKVVGISKKHFFKEEVKKAWIPLLLHCQDPCPDAAQVSEGHPAVRSDTCSPLETLENPAGNCHLSEMLSSQIHQWLTLFFHAVWRLPCGAYFWKACVATVFQCAHFWGWKAPESSSGRSDSSTADEMTVLQTTLCSILTQKKPAVLYSFLLGTMTYVSSNLPRIRSAACDLAGVIMKQMSAHHLKKLDFPALRDWPARGLPRKTTIWAWSPSVPQAFCPAPHHEYLRNASSLIPSTDPHGARVLWVIFVSPLEASRRPRWGDVCADTAPPAVSWLQTQGFPFLSPREPRAVTMVAWGEQGAFHWLSGPRGGGDGRAGS